MKFKNSTRNNIHRKVFMKSKYFQKLDNYLNFSFVIQHKKHEKFSEFYQLIVYVS
jgi:hypothetical protein